ncbi:hypothetical protein EVJ58_g7482 [Rhodofomes roseus]|uniref:Uncharacterized protein n=1 Tax=Rhodofomes roseus TaxID=34475 RepID=A0A4Y9Y5J3_9APHY|nr:hypothetical protein EVJ58_g7482 [Rhodofomes roseus]
MPRCGYCKHQLPTTKGVKLHIQSTPACRRKWEQQLARVAQAIASSGNVAAAAAAASSTGVASSVQEDTAQSFELGSQDADDPMDGGRSSRQAHVEDVPEDEEDARRYVENYPGVVASIIREDNTLFETWCATRAAAEVDEWAPFKDQDEWELFRWLIKHVGQNNIDEFLKLSIIRKNCGLDADSKYKFFKQIDDLPTGVPWHCDMITVRGDRTGDDGNFMEEQLELWRRDPVECVEDLIGNPTFDGNIAYAPERVYTEEAATIRRYDEMWTADWWWNTQRKLPEGATVAPVILASDATKLTNFGGDKKAWPVYLSIGNISKSIRRQPSQRATVLVGYIPVSKLECFNDSTRSLAGYRLFHHCMTLILKSLREPGRNGKEMTCADRGVRSVHPIVAAYVADYPEQCLVCCCKENSCPRCTVPPPRRGEQLNSPPRDIEKTKEALREHSNGNDPPCFTSEQLRPVYEPFWADLPYCDIFTSIMPDILHQLHKGVFKEHLLSWCTSIVGKDEIDRRFRAMTDFPGLRHFRNGISHVSQWTGREHKEMQRVFVGLLAGAVSSDVLIVARALVDFIYYAQLQSHDDESLAHLQTALDTFHRHKNVFIRLGVREHFNIPKFHSLLHYVEAIRSHGSCDGYNTELPERLHIELAKNAYRATNHRDYIEQMVTWLSRQEAIDLHASYIAWFQGLRAEETAEEMEDEYPDLEPDDDEDDEADEDADDEENLSNDGSENERLRTYTIAKHCPLPNMSLHRLQTEHGASEFLPALTEFVQTELPQCRLKPNHMDRYDVYKNISVTYPGDPHGDVPEHTDRVRAVAAKPARGRKQRAPAHFDTAFVIDPEAPVTGPRNPRSVTGTRIARVRVIFDLPPQFGSLPHPLAYVEWYTPLRRKDPATDLFLVSRSTRNNKPNASIVSIDRICRAAHLIPKYGGEISRNITKDNALDVAMEFRVNTYIAIDLRTAKSG